MARAARAYYRRQEFFFEYLYPWDQLSASFIKDRRKPSIPSYFVLQGIFFN